MTKQTEAEMTAEATITAKGLDILTNTILTLKTDRDLLASRLSEWCALADADEHCGHLTSTRRQLLAESRTILEAIRARGQS